MLWSDQATTFAGTVLALGGTQFGKGGFVETSSGGQLGATGSVNGGEGGTWLLSTRNLSVNSALAAAISSTLSGGSNVAASTSVSDIAVNSPINWTSAATLSLNAYRNINLPQLSSPNIKNTGAGNLVLHANKEGAFAVGSGAGTITGMASDSVSNRIDWSASSGGVTTFYNPTSYATPTDFTSGNGRFLLAAPDQLTSYMLVNSSSELQNINQNLSANYALSKDIYAAGMSFTPIGPVFNGQFDGLSHTISNLTVAPTTRDVFNIGLFGAIGPNGAVRNLTFDHASAAANSTAAGSLQFVGILAGTNNGLITNVNTTNSSVNSVTVQDNVIAGGLVGKNGSVNGLGTITLSDVATSVTVGNANGGSSANAAGGIAGSNAGTITLSKASGSIFGGSYSNLGGLVGTNQSTATVASSVASGQVTLSDLTGSNAGGAVGLNLGSLSAISASGVVTGAASSDLAHAGALGGLIGWQAAGGVTGNGTSSGSVSGGSNTSVGGFIGSNAGNVIASNSSGGSTSATNYFGGGFVGLNSGTISASNAAGNVNGGGRALGAFVGANVGTISNSSATGVLDGGGQNLGGFAGTNEGAILSSQAKGNTNNTSADGVAGGFVGSNSGSISASLSLGNVTALKTAGGFAGTNEKTGSISTGNAHGAVTVDSGGVAAGFVGENFGQVASSGAFGAVSGGENTLLGGFVGRHLGGAIADLSSSGSVTSHGTNSVVGGFAAFSACELVHATSSGPVTGTSNSFLGGLVGINFAKITDSASSSTVTGTGGKNTTGGFVAANFGDIDPSFSSGNVTSGAESTVGGFVGVNAAIKFSDGTQYIGIISSEFGWIRCRDRRIPEHRRAAGWPVISGGRPKHRDGFVL